MSHQLTRCVASQRNQRQTSFITDNADTLYTGGKKVAYLLPLLYQQLLILSEKKSG